MKKLITAILLVVLLGFGTYSYAGNKTASGVTAQTIIDRVRASVNDRTADFWTDADILHWTDEAVREVVYQTRCLETGVSTISYPLNSRSWSLSGLTWLDVETVEYNSGVTWTTLASGETIFNSAYIYSLDRVPIIDYNANNEKEIGNPKVFWVWNNSIYIWPFPTETRSGAASYYYVYYIPLPSGVTAASSAIETPSYFDSAILDYVRAQAWYRADYVKRGEYFMKMFYARIQSYLVNIMRRNLFEMPPAQK